MNKYITEEEYLKYKGVNLTLELADDDNASHKVERFIHEITNWCEKFIVLEYAENDIMNFQGLKEFRQMRFRQGVMEQIEYVLNNGWVNKASGLNKELGIIIDYSKIKIAPTALEEFRMGAFCNIKGC